MFRIAKKALSLQAPGRQSVRATCAKRLHKLQYFLRSTECPNTHWWRDVQNSHVAFVSRSCALAISFAGKAAWSRALLVILWCQCKREDPGFSYPWELSKLEDWDKRGCSGCLHQARRCFSMGKWSVEGRSDSRSPPEGGAIHYFGREVDVSPDKCDYRTFRKNCKHFQGEWSCQGSNCGWSSNPV